MQDKIILNVDPLKYPRDKGESWWIVHPNYSKCEFKIPEGGAAICIVPFLHFKHGVAYSIVDNDENNGWLSIDSSAFTTRMPYYIFARYFDAEAFIRGTVGDPRELDRAVPFNYQSTVPFKASDIKIEYDDNMPKDEIQMRDVWGNIVGRIIKSTDYE